MQDKNIFIEISNQRFKRIINIDFINEIQIEIYKDEIRIIINKQEELSGFINIEQLNYIRNKFLYNNIFLIETEEIFKGNCTSYKLDKILINEIDIVLLNPNNYISITNKKETKKFDNYTIYNEKIYDRLLQILCNK